MKRGGSTYLLTNKYHTTLYTGVTAELFNRLIEHREKHYPKSFTARYNLYKLVYVEDFSTITEAIKREKEIKGMSRKKKEMLINESNPEWRDLFEDMKDW